MSRGVVVLGMHRSGTSAVTRAINLLGVPVNMADDWIAADEDNPRGYWESQALVGINNDILAALGGGSVCPPPLPHGWERDVRLDTLVERAASSLHAVFPTAQWVWKDPRTCLTLPLWRRILDPAPVVVLVYRNPLEVATSLSARDRLTKSHCLALWERYVRQSLCSAVGLPVRVTRYENLLEAPTVWCEQTRDFLVTHGIKLQKVEGDPLRAVTEFIAKDLRHHAHPDEDVWNDPDVSRPQAELLSLLRLLEGEYATFHAPELPRETTWAQDLLAANRQINLQAERVAQAEQAKSWLEQQVANWQHATEEYKHQLEELRAHLTAVEEAKSWLEEQAASWRRVAEEKERRLARTRKFSL